MKMLSYIALSIIVFLSTQGVLYEARVAIPSFAVDEYENMIKERPSDLVLGPVPSVEVAKEMAEKVWVETFGEKLGSGLADLKPYEVYFDVEKQVWLVHGTLPDGWWGGYGYVLIQKQDGKVLSTWFEQ